MNLPLDIHTHQLPPVAGLAIENCYPDTFSPRAGGWYSVGIHPRHLTEVSARMNLLARLARHPQVLAIGEAGLDKLAEAPLEVQIACFRQQALLAIEVDKPLIIHLVKATDELLKLKQSLPSTRPWIIHGFRGKAALAQEYLRHGFYLSFGEKYHEDALRILPAGRLLIETDESTVAVEELYKRAARLRGIACGELRETIIQTVRTVYF